MIDFKTFLREDGAVATKRKGLEHLENMRPAAFVSLMQALHQRFPSGKLTDVAINVKVDGMAFRFGRNANGRPFVETSYSGPVFEPGRFTAYAQERGDAAMVARAAKIEEAFAIILKSRAIIVVPNDRKVVCELLYNPLGEVTASGAIKFVSVEYDRNKLGRVMTLVPRAVVVSSTNEEAPDAKTIVQDLLEVSSPDIKIVTTRLQHEPIDVSATIDAAKTLTPKMLELLGSRKAADKEAKAVVVQTIQAMKERLADVILHHKGFRGADVLGDQIEGLVLSFGDHEIKITTPETKQAVAARQTVRGVQK